MPAPKHRSRTLRRMQIKTPGRRVVTHYENQKAKKPVCSSCGAVLSGMPGKMNRMPKSRKRPERPYGGKLCTRCMRQKIIQNSLF